MKGFTRTLIRTTGVLVLLAGLFIAYVVFTVFYGFDSPPVLTGPQKVDRCQS
jgi:hypothetical protein